MKFLKVIVPTSALMVLGGIVFADGLKVENSAIELDRFIFDVCLKRSLSWSDVPLVGFTKASNEYEEYLRNFSFSRQADEVTALSALAGNLIITQAEIFSGEGNLPQHRCRVYWSSEIFNNQEDFQTSKIKLLSKIVQYTKDLENRYEIERSWQGISDNRTASAWPQEEDPTLVKFTYNVYFEHDVIAIRSIVFNRSDAFATFQVEDMNVQYIWNKPE